jgi:5,10-methylenetetrahydrofolate reductase
MGDGGSQESVPRGPPVLFEALPPQVGSTQEQWQDHLGLLEPLRHAGLAGVNVPEIVNGHYTTVEPRAFAAALQRRLGVRAILNRITVHHSLPELQSWATETRVGHAIHDLVLVGGESSAQRHPGVGVVEALGGLRASVQAGGGHLGVVTIPTRRRKDLDEPERLLRKQEAGADFAVSQILCEPEAALRLQADLAARGPAAGHKPLTLFWSLAPVARKRDLEFLRWLGVDLPAYVRRGLMVEASPEARLRRSNELNLAIARRLLEGAEAGGAGAGAIGFCVEHVMLSNIEAAIDLVSQIRELTREFAESGTTPFGQFVEIR